MQIRFDRGTILIDPSRADVDPEKLPGVSWDPRVRTWRAPADAYVSIVGRLSDEGIRFADATPDHQTPTTGWSTPELRWYQRDALAAWGAANRRGVIALPTGAGKTTLKPVVPDGLVTRGREFGSKKRNVRGKPSNRPPKVTSANSPFPPLENRSPSRSTALARKQKTPASLRVF